MRELTGVEPHRQLRYSLMAADKHSFARAADALGTKQSTLSKKVTDLAIRLGRQ